MLSYDECSLIDVYQIEKNILNLFHPHNSHISDKIRQNRILHPNNQ